MTTIKGILIDPFDKTVKEVDVKRPGLQPLYDLIQCDCFTVIGMDEGDGMYLDDEALLTTRQKDPKDGLFKGFIFKAYSLRRPLLGRGLILGSNDEGDSTNHKVDIEHIKPLIRWWSGHVGGM